MSNLDIQGLHNTWADTARTPMLGPVSGYVVFPIMLFFMHIRWWTLGVLGATIVLMIVLSRFGYTAPVAVLALRARIAGPVVSRFRKIGGYRIWR